jgi:hypothetical protein
MSEYLTGNFIRAEELQPNVIYEHTIVSVDVQNLLGKDQPIIWFGNERGIVLNYTRLKVMIDNFGPDSDNWPGQTIRYHRAPTTFQGLPVATIEIMPPPIRQIAP